MNENFAEIDKLRRNSLSADREMHKNLLAVKHEVLDRLKENSANIIKNALHLSLDIERAIEGPRLNTVLAQDEMQRIVETLAKNRAEQELARAAATMRMLDDYARMAGALVENTTEYEEKAENDNED